MSNSIDVAVPPPPKAPKENYKSMNEAYGWRMWRTSAFTLFGTLVAGRGVAIFLLLFYCDPFTIGISFHLIYQFEHIRRVMIPIYIEA